MPITLNGTSNAITFPDNSIQNTSAIVSGYVPYANLPAGSVLQTVSGFTNTQASTSGPYTDTTLTATITPRFATSKILVLISQNGIAKSSGSTQSGAFVKLQRNGSDLILLAAPAMYTATALTLYGGGISSTFLDSPATTSALTYKTQLANNTSAATVYCQISNEVSTITLLEIAV
jgi:hypothetical protein